MPTRSKAIIETLGMQPHPEGGHYVEMWRDEGVRGACSAIYFLLQAGEASHWHKVDATEIWFFHDGAPLALSLAPPDQPPTTQILGNDLAAGQRPQGVVPRDVWQSARSLGEWSLVSCTVAPAFEFAGFTLAPPGWAPPPGAEPGPGSR